jgi:membrane protease YdiL (CAAX protease family)
MFARFVLTEGMDLSRSGPAELVNQLTSYFRGNLVLVLGVAQAATIVYGLLAIGLRIRPHGVRRLGWQFPWLGHWLLVVLMMPPLCLLCSVLQNVMFQWMPGSEASIKELMDSLGQAPLSLLVLVIGLGPALAEELVFRGLVGRGLVARRGLVQGMLITSVLFGVMHINAAQAIGVIPLGFAMHFVYFTTRSFWSPVTLHLFNNSLSVILLKQEADMPVNKLLETNSELPVALLVVALAMVTAIGILLWQTRVQYVLPDGSHWNPGYTSTAAPPPEVHAVAMRRSAGLQLLAVSLFSVLAFAVAAWQRTR